VTKRVKSSTFIVYSQKFFFLRHLSVSSYAELERTLS
jgi:hypothetical protein